MSAVSADRAQPEGRSLFLARVESLSEAEKWARGQPEEVVLALAEAIVDLDIVNVSARSGRYSSKRMALRGRRSACSPVCRHLLPPPVKVLCSAGTHSWADRLIWQWHWAKKYANGAADPLRVIEGRYMIPLQRER